MKKILRTALMIIFIFGMSVSAEKYVRPCGETIGIKMYTDGLLVVDKDKNIGNIKTGDIIVSANGKTLSRTEDLKDAALGADKVELEIIRSGERISETVTPMPAPEGKRLGLWLRDSTAGIGTLTYISDDGKSFAALGHGITDVDTGSILTLKSGNILTCSEIMCTKSKKGDIGEISARFNENEAGDICVNSPIGIYGSVKNIKKETYAAMQVAQIGELYEGDAYILCNVGQGVNRYSAKVERVLNDGTKDKSIIIKVTDENLLSITGGIIQGMSGSPIIQNGKFIGAVTHVFVNNPKRGYGIAGEYMLESE